MGKQSKVSKPESFGKGKVTPVQVAFIVDRYLSDNNYTKTLSVFRTEASNHFSRTKGGQAPKGLLSLGAILDEYICLKEQKLIVDNEKCRVERLLQGMQNVMNSYNSCRSIAPTAMAVATPIPQICPKYGSHEGHLIYNNTTGNSMHMLPSNNSDSTNFSTPITSLPPKNKRKASMPVSDVTPSVKKSCAVLPMNLSAVEGTKIPLQEANNNGTNENVRKFSDIQTSSHNNTQNENSVRRSCIARNLFEQTPKPKTVSPCPKTPPQPFPSQADKSVSPSESSSLCHSSSHDTPPEIIPTSCHVFSSKTVIISPYKHIRISSSPLKSNLKRSNKRDHVKGRLDFNDSDMPMCSEKPGAEEIFNPAIPDETVDIFNTGVPNFDVFDADFSFSDLLVDLDLHSDEMGLPLQQALDSSFDFITGPDNEFGFGGIETNRASFEPMSSVTSFLSGKDISNPGSDSLISVKSITKCIQIVSPVKHRMSSSSEQVN